jgi:hypothetical protein
LGLDGNELSGLTITLASLNASFGSGREVGAASMIALPVMGIPLVDTVRDDTIVTVERTCKTSVDSSKKSKIGEFKVVAVIG